MCMECPEQQEGALVERWRIQKLLRANLFGEAADLVNTLNEATNGDADRCYAEMNEETN